MTEKKESTNTPENEYPSVLSFEGNVVCSDALLSQSKWGSSESKPLEIKKKDVRGTKSQHFSDDEMQDEEKLKSKAIEPNPHHIEYCALSRDCDTLVHEFTVNFIDSIYKPSSCSDPKFASLVRERVEEYIHGGSIKVIAEGYAKNIANARFLHRNRVGADEIQVNVILDDNFIVFDGISGEVIRTNEKKPLGFDDLVNVIAKGLTDGHQFISVKTFVLKKWGQPVYPSQQLVREDKNKDKKEKSINQTTKFLYSVDGQAAMTEQKIGNALRTIDVWHGSVDKVGAIPVEPYGAITQNGICHRGVEDNFYKLIKDWVWDLNEVSKGNTHFLVAMLIRGGLFGKKNEDDKSSKKSTKRSPKK